MKPRIEKKLSKRLLQISPSLFEDAWIDNEWEHWTKHYAHNDETLTPRQIRENLQQRVSVNHVPSVGGGVDYWGEGQDAYTLWEAWTGYSHWAWEWHGNFPDYPEDHEFHGYPDTSSFRPTTRNLLKLAAQCQLVAEAKKRAKQCA